MSADLKIDPFAVHSPFSDPKDHVGMLARWPDDMAGMMAAVQNLLIYDVVAEPFYGVRLSPNRLMDIHLRYVEDIFDRALQICPVSLGRQRPPGERVAARCNNFGLVLISALRSRGVAARARVGFASYFTPSTFEDHWVVEYRDQANRTWRYADPQLDDVWCERLDIRHDPADVPGACFLPAAGVWQRCRSGDMDPATAGIGHANLYGLFFVAGSLVRDMAALNKSEMLPWDVWGAQPAPFADMSNEQLDYFDELAALLIEPDSSIDVIRDRYLNDPQLRVGESTYNALLRKTESVAHHA